MPELRYGLSDLAPVISEETLNYHYGKHLQTYVNQLNTLIEATEYEDMVLADIIREAPAGPLFNNAGQVFNHAMYFEQFAAPVKEGEENLPTGALEEAIYASFGDFETFRQLMSDAALKLFGSGWAWLAEDKDGRLSIIQKQNAGNPMTDGLNPLMTVDVWEHAYYIDYRNRRADYIGTCLGLTDWGKAEDRLMH